MERTNRDVLRHEVLGSGRSPARLLQWIGFFLPPLVFFVHLETAYNLVPWECTKQEEVWMHVVGALAVLLSLAGNGAAWMSRARTPEAANDPPGHPVEGPGALWRTRFVADTGLGLGAMITLVLIAQWIAGFFITVCQ
jgi:hypothetical protein